MTGLGPVTLATGTRRIVHSPGPRPNGHVKHISGWPDVHRRSAVGDRRRTSYQLTEPFSRECLLRFTSGLQGYTNADGVGVWCNLSGPQARLGRVRARETFPSKTFVMITLDVLNVNHSGLLHTIPL